MNVKAKQLGLILIIIMLLTGAAAVVSATNLGDDILSQWVNATWFKGDGGNITNVNTNNIPNFTVAARNTVSATGNTTYNSTTGQIDSVTNISAVRGAISAGANLTYNAVTGVVDYIVPAASAYNATYDATTKTVNGNLANWNSTYNSTYDAKVGSVSGGSSPITSSGTTAITLGCTAASTSVAGCLSSTDWNTFNGKQAALGYTAENTANKGAASGYAPLVSSKVPTANLGSGSASSLTYLRGDQTYATPSLNSGNLLSGLTPTFSGFSTNPGTTADLIDETTDTLTTNGVGNVGQPYIQYDLGSTKRVQIYYMHSSSPTGYSGYVKISTDGTNYYYVGIPISNAVNIWNTVGMGNARYIRFYFGSSGGVITYTNIKMRVYNI